MHFLTNSRPIHPKRKQIRTELSHSAIFSIFPSSQSPLRGQDATPGKLRSSAVVKLQRVKPKAKSRLNVYPTQEEALIELKICLDSVGTEQQPAICVQMKKNLSCRNIESRNSSQKHQKQESSKQRLKNYFKHLNLEAQNHSSFIGTSAFLHHRQTKEKTKNLQSQLTGRIYRNGFQSILLKPSPRQFSYPQAENSVKNQLCKSGRDRAFIGPWENSHDDGPGIVMAKAIIIRNNRVRRMKSQ